MISSNGLLYEFFILCFKIASHLLRQRAHLNGAMYLKNLPDRIIFTPTHDSYFEVPSLSYVYYAIKPRPEFVIMAKKDFLSGNYLTTNFGKKNKIAYAFCYLLDKSGLPTRFFKKMKLIEIPRPFIEEYRDSSSMKTEIAAQMEKLKHAIHNGFSTLIFPEGTTWGFGGLKSLRSGIYQLVDSTYRHFKQKLYILPINVKVDRCVVGIKDIFINIGKPVFILDDKENFLNKLSDILKSLHTITFSQIASAYLQRLSMKVEHINQTIILKKEEIAAHIDALYTDIHSLVKEGKLPNIDEYLFDENYRYKKLHRFLKYCEKKGFIKKVDNSYLINTHRILSSFPIKSYRKENPIGFSANELLSIDYSTVSQLLERYSTMYLPIKTHV